MALIPKKISLTREEAINFSKRKSDNNFEYIDAKPSQRGPFSSFEVVIRNLRNDKFYIFELTKKDGIYISPKKIKLQEAEKKYHVKEYWDIK